MNPYEKYQQQMVTTMTQGDMLMMLYDGVLKQIEIGRVSIENNQVNEMDTALRKAQKIIQYLKSNLDHRYAISKNLGMLYDFFYEQLVMASIKKDAKPLNDIAPLILDLRNTYEQCDKINRSGRTGYTAGSAI